MHNPDACDLTAPFQFYGTWWREGLDEDGGVPGCLSYTPDHGLQLQLYGDLPGDTFLSGMNPRVDRPIWGEVSALAGRVVPVSLFKPLRTNRPNNPREEDKPSDHTIYFVNRAVFGVHAEALESIKLTSIRFSLSEFELFANTKSVSAHYHGDGLRAEIKPVQRPPVKIQEPALQISMKTHFGCSASLFDRSFTIRYREDITIAPAIASPFDNCMQIVHTLTNFFLLCARDAVDLEYVRGTLESGETISYFDNRSRRKVRPSAKDWVLKLEDIGGSFEDALNQWFVLVKKLRFVRAVFFSELSDPSRIQDARFFHFAGCLEAYHREVLSTDVGKSMPSGEFTVLARELLDHLPPEVPEPVGAAIRSAVMRANDHTFAERLGVLFGLLEAETQRMLAVEPTRFLAAIKHSRNKMAHVLDDTHADSFEGKEFAHANLAIRAWLTILMLKECGISERVVRERMEGIGYFFWGPFQFQPRIAL